VAQRRDLARHAQVAVKLRAAPSLHHVETPFQAIYLTQPLLPVECYERGGGRQERREEDEREQERQRTLVRPEAPQRAGRRSHAIHGAPPSDRAAPPATWSAR